MPKRPLSPVVTRGIACAALAIAVSSYLVNVHQSTDTLAWVGYLPAVSADDILVNQTSRPGGTVVLRPVTSRRHFLGVEVFRSYNISVSAVTTGADPVQMTMIRAAVPRYLLSLDPPPRSVKTLQALSVSTPYTEVSWSGITTIGGLLISVTTGAHAFVSHQRHRLERRRYLRDECVKCGYPVARGAACPECGSVSNQP
jgi:hypothetical protein